MTDCTFCTWPDHVHCAICCAICAAEDAAALSVTRKARK